MLFMTGGDQPVLRCAICDKPILAAASAVVVYPRGIRPGETHRVCLAHPGSCQTQAQSNLENEDGLGLVMTLLAYGDRLRGASSASAPG